jgi:hypothetical protein
VLVLAPPGLRDQWRQELAERFGIDAPGVDGHALRRLAHFALASSARDGLLDAEQRLPTGNGRKKATFS